MSNKKGSPSPFPPEIGTTKRDWNKIVADSHGSRVFVPEDIAKKFADIQERREAWNDEAAKLAEKEINIQVDQNAAYLEMRTYISKNGNQRIWLKDMGLDSNALQDGVYVVNVSERQQ